jgi:hypothetical protein
MATPEGRWTLNPTALASLIERLGAGDPQEYETIRRKLIGFLELRGALRPEVAADETLDRVAREPAGLRVRRGPPRAAGRRPPGAARAGQP